MRLWVLPLAAARARFDVTNGTTRQGPCAGCCPAETCQPYYAPFPAEESRRFYLHRPVDYDDLLACLRSHGADERPDDLFGASAALMIDLQILRSLQTHRARTRDAREAYLHIMDFPFYAAYLVPRMLSCYNSSTQMQKMAVLEEEFPKLWKTWQNKTWLVINGDGQPPDTALGCLWVALHTEWAPDTWVYATVDQDFATSNMYFGNSPFCPAYPSTETQRVATKFIVMPYVAHHLVERHNLRHTDACLDWNNRSTSIMFHGTLHRRRDSRMRGTVLGLAKEFFAADIKDIAGVPTDHSNVVDNASTLMYQTARSYLSSRFCFVPEGDPHTSTSRRLYDTLAAACVPVAFSRDCLPFIDHVNYSAISLETGPLRCCAQHTRETFDWFRARFRLNNATDARDELLFHRMACFGADVFRNFLSYRNGAATNNLLRHFSIQSY